MKRQMPIIAWNGNTPIYATPALLDWKRRMREAREWWERTADDTPEREDARAAYFAIMCETAGPAPWHGWR